MAIADQMKHPSLHLESALSSEHWRSIRILVFHITTLCSLSTNISEDDTASSFIYPEDLVRMFLQNLAIQQQDYMVS
jgi:hypothetical protein